MRLRRAGTFGKIAEIYRGKRLEFADVEGGFANIDIKGDIVDDECNLVCPYEIDSELELRENQYDSIVQSMSKLVMDAITKKTKHATKRGLITTTCDKKRKAKKRISLTPVDHSPLTIIDQVKQTKEPSSIRNEKALSKKDDIDTKDVDSIFNSMFANVNDDDMTELLMRLEKSQTNANDKEEDEDEQKEDDEQGEEEDDEERENDEQVDDIDEIDEEETYQAHFTNENDMISTLYKDDEVIESGPLDNDTVHFESDQDDDDDDDEHNMSSRKQRRHRNVSSSSDEEEDETHLDDPTALFGNDPLIANDDDDYFDMYDGLGDFYAGGGNEDD